MVAEGSDKVTAVDNVERVGWQVQLLFPVEVDPNAELGGFVFFNVKLVKVASFLTIYFFGMVRVRA